MALRITGTVEVHTALWFIPT